MENNSLKVRSLCRNCVALSYCILLHRNCYVTALRCHMKDKLILTWNAVMLQWLVAESNRYIGTATQGNGIKNRLLQQDDGVFITQCDKTVWDLHRGSNADRLHHKVFAHIFVTWRQCNCMDSRRLISNGNTFVIIWNGADFKFL